MRISITTASILLLLLAPATAQQPQSDSVTSAAATCGAGRRVDPTAKGTVYIYSNSTLASACPAIDAEIQKRQAAANDEAMAGVVAAVAARLKNDAAK